MKAYRSALIALCLACLCQPAFANPGKSHGHGHQKAAHKDTSDAVDVAAATIFTAAERAIIAAYFHDQWQAAEQTGTLPPGLAKRQSLPPGLQKQLARKGTLPPGLAKRALPADLIARLGTPAKGTARYIAGDDVLLVDTATNVILDVIRGALAEPARIKWND